jgi:putative endonuclease
VSSAPAARGATRSTGNRAERLAREYLEAAGLETLQTNYRCRAGEIDLVMRDGATLVMVEVRYRANARSIDPAVTVTAAKQRRILNTARHYLQRHAAFADAPMRFDVVAVTESLDRPRLAWIRDGFDASGIMGF